MELLNCCRLNNLEELLSMGLYINELNMYDGSRDMVMAGWQHASKLESLIEQVNNTLSLVFVRIHHWDMCSYYCDNTNTTWSYELVRQST